MASNIQLSKANMAVVDGYFFSFNEVLDVLFEITADGTTAFSYPLDTPLTKVIKTIEHDGTNFWTLEEGATSGEDVVVKRWLIDNYVCKLQQTIEYTGTGTHKYDCDTFTIEHYHTVVTGTVTSGSSIIGVVTGYGDQLSSGMKVNIGPNSSGYSETIAVAGGVDGTISLQDPTDHAYSADDVVSFYTDLWLFNNYDGITAAAGALYNFNPYGGSSGYITKYPGAVYADIKGSTFFKVTSFQATHGIVDTLVYAKASNLLFVNTTPSAGELSYYGSMAMDNIAAGGGSVYEILDLTMDEKNIFRLQNIDGGNNYRLSTQEPLVSSIAIESDQAILPANGIATTVILATVKDQFFQPVAGRYVTFAHNDTSGTPAIFTTSNPDTTDSAGIANITYQSGDEAADVTITATVEQT